MATPQEEFAALEASLPTLKAEYRTAMEAFQALPRTGIPVADVRQALRRWHQKAVDYFNAYERSISLGAVVGANSNSTWYTEKCETAANLLQTIAHHYETVWAKGDDLHLPRNDMQPGMTAYGSMQRAAKAHDPAIAKVLRAKFVAQGLPTHGFDKGESERPERLETRFYVLGMLSFVVAVGLSVWGFYLRDLSQDQRYILRSFVALGTGFGVWSFSGVMTVTSNQPALRLVVSATGGFGAWLLTYFLFAH